MKGWDSTRVIGNVDEMFEHYKSRARYSGDPDWSPFYNGWLDGRLEMLREMEDE